MAQSRMSAQRVPTHTARGWAQHQTGPLVEPGASTRSSEPYAPVANHTALCLWLPTFELRLELVRAPELDRTSVALLSEGEHTRRTVWQVSERAHESGVRPGQTVAHAVSLCPALTLLEPDPAHYDAATDILLETLTEVSPVLEPAGRGRVFLGMDGLERLFGEPSRQIERTFAALFSIFPAPLVATFRAGMAPGRFGSWVAATSARPGVPVVVPERDLTSFLGRCPVRILPVDGRMIERLERLGIDTLEALRALPEPALIAQFGEAGRDAHAWASGRRIDPVRPWHKPRPLRASLAFTNPVGLVDTLHGALERLVERALSRSTRRGRSVVGVRLGAHLEGGGSWVVEATLREPTTERERIAGPLRVKMALTPPAKAVETLFFEITDFGAPSTQESLFGRKEAGGRAEAGSGPLQGEVPPSLRDAVKELKLRLGDSPLYRVVELDPWSRIPERRHALLRFDP
jgi:DNA polymerase-4/protein ImuB